MLDRRAIRRFLKYVVVGSGTFLFDLGLLFVFTDVFKLQYLVATGVSFVTAITCNYLLSRRYVFAGTERGFYAGGLYYLVAGSMALVAVTSLMAFFVEVLHWHYLPSRIIIAAVVGMVGYLFNLFLNFKLAGKYPKG